MNTCLLRKRETDVFVARESDVFVARKRNSDVFVARERNLDVFVARGRNSDVFVARERNSDVFCCAGKKHGLPRPPAKKKKKKLRTMQSEILACEQCNRKFLRANDAIGNSSLRTMQSEILACERCSGLPNEEFLCSGLANDELPCCKLHRCFTDNLSSHYLLSTIVVDNLSRMLSLKCRYNILRSDQMCCDRFSVA